MVSRRHGLSLLSGWLPPTVEVVAVLVLVGVLVWLLRRSGRRCGLLWPAAAVVLAAAAAGLAWWSLRDQGLAADPAPVGLWVWIAATGAALVLLVWACSRRGWTRRATALVALALAALCVGLEANEWVGYFTTVPEAWEQLSAGPLPDQVDPAALPALRGTTTTTGKVVAISTPDDVSHFAHRTEYVYLPPAWFAPGRPVLPALMMIGGEFSTPTDWIRTGDAIATADHYAQTHGGVAPVLVFADSTGSFRNDTECVNGPRGNAATHLTDELRPYVTSHFGVAAAPRQWGVVGWSAGGTCAVDLGVTHPELFGTFEDIQGDLAPNAGDAQQTLADLYGGNSAAAASFDPATVLAHHAAYPDSAGWFADSPPPKKAPTTHAATRDRPGAGFGGRGDPAPLSMQGQQASEAHTLCAEATARQISCSVHLHPGKHTWQFARSALSEALPWLAQRLQPPPNPGAAA